MFLALVLGIVLLSLADPKRVRREYLLLLLVFIVMFSMMDMNKGMMGDWVWYTEHYRRLEHMSLSSYIGARMGWITIKWNEPTYYAIAKAVAVLSGGSIAALAAVLTALNYSMIGWATYRVGKDIFRSAGRLPSALILMACVLLAMNFTLTTHLIRQELAASFGILGYSFLRSRQYVAAGVLALLAVTTHQSAALLLLVLYTPPFITLNLKRYPLARRFAILGALMVAALLGYYVSHSEIVAIGQKNDGSVSIVIFLLDAVIFGGLVLVTTFLRPAGPQARELVLSFLLFAAAMAFMMTIPLAALRMYFYIDFVRSLALVVIAVCLLRYLPRSMDNIVAGIPMLFLGLCYVQFRLDRSPFDFGGDLIHYMLYPIS
ncbi:EpsG family protein [Novosphingobium gossypii]|uniref:EpsG family protein n=1 Tax=Novosphingobium gossypii TaxID=1604774 RepID=UPI003D252E71